MPLQLSDIVPLRLLDDALERGLVRKAYHPELPLVILNYTERAAYDGEWNAATLLCRGLIVDTDTSDVVARPLPKFFNYGQPGAPEFDLDAPAVVTEKLDGSLGILYPTADGVGAIATRGSFTSDQALHATDVWRRKYAGGVVPGPGLTYIFEIVYPENRIVCDYGDLDDLVFLACVQNSSGRLSWRTPWYGLRTEEHAYFTLAAALAAEPRPGAEGLVVYLPDANQLVKLKQADYVALHRIVTGLNKRTVWAHLEAGLPIADLIEPLPDEFRPWVEDVVAELSALVVGQAREIERRYDEIVAELDSWTYVGEEGAPGFENGWRNVGVPDVPGKPWSRKQFADLAKQSEWAWALFLRLDGRDYGRKLWRNARPEAVGPTGRVYSEDAA